jgi:MOSC domain-containing protein YiiM
VPEVKPDLRVDEYVYTDQDALATIRNLGVWWDLLLEGHPVPPGVEELQREQVRVLAAGLGQTAPTCSPLPTIALLANIATDEIRVGQVSAEAFLAPSLRLLRDAGEALRAAGALPATATGELVQINVSDGGVPKRPIPSTSIGFSGLDGDRQGSRKHHGRPWQALCLWSTDVVDRFAADGHPIFYGACGENLSIRGLPWPEVRPGVRFRIGTVLAEASLYSLPCKNNAPWFTDRDFTRIHHERGPVSRMYASVLEPGEVSVGDEVVLEP